MHWCDKKSFNFLTGIFWVMVAHSYRCVLDKIEETFIAQRNLYIVHSTHSRAHFFPVLSYTGKAFHCLVRTKETWQHLDMQWWNHYLPAINLSIFQIAVIGKSLSQRTSSKGDVWHFQLNLIVRPRIHINVSLFWFSASKVFSKLSFFFFKLLGETSCVIKGEAHPVNSSFITRDCLSQCICMAGGVASCVNLCTQMVPKCPPGGTLKEEDEPIGSGGVSCSCIRRYCVPPKGILVSLTSLFVYRFQRLWELLQSLYQIFHATNS